MRIICLGDSCTKLSIQTWPYSVELERRLGSAQVEVFNASLPGYTSYQGLVWLERQLLAYQPDLVTVYFGWNDHWRYTGRSDRDFARALSPWRPRLLNLLRRPADPPPLRVTLGDFADNLRSMTKLVAANGGKTILVTPPSLFNAEIDARLDANGYIVSGDDPARLHQQYTGAVRAAAHAPGALLFDLAAIFAELDEAALLLHRDGIHPTDLGHQVIGALLRDVIAQQVLGLPERASPSAAVALGVMAQWLAAAGRWPEALDRYRRALTIDPEHEGLQLGLAWLLATCPDAAWRDPAGALALLDTEAVDPTLAIQRRDVRAAALAADGRFTEAAQVLRPALQQLDDLDLGGSALFRSMQERLRLYESGQPFFMPAPPPPPSS